jgi:valyl-tRNA synthetase
MASSSIAALDHIVVATTRPETMLADMAVAVNAEDPRYKSVIGKFVELPITGRRVPIVADEHADPELGSGAVKITPGHDFNDFEVGKRAGIKPGDMLNMFDAEARVVQTADGLIPDDLVGMDRFDARDMAGGRADEGAGFLVPHITRTRMATKSELDAEPRTIQTPFGDRGGVVIEPWLTDQWYVDAETPRPAADTGGARWPDRNRAQELGKDLLQLDGEYPALVCFAAAMVGAPDSGLVCRG